MRNGNGLSPSIPELPTSEACAPSRPSSLQDSSASPRRLVLDAKRESRSFARVTVTPPLRRSVMRPFETAAACRRWRALSNRHAVPRRPPRWVSVFSSVATSSRYYRRRCRARPGARSKAPGVPWFCGDTRCSSRRRRGYHPIRVIPWPAAAPLPARSAACDAPAVPRGRTAAAATESTASNSATSPAVISRRCRGVSTNGSSTSNRGRSRLVCLTEPRAIAIAIEPQHRCGDHVNLHRGELEATMPGHSLDALAHDQQCVLGQVDQDWPRPRHWAYLPKHAVPVATERAMSSPSHVLGALGGTADSMLTDRRKGPRGLIHQPARWVPGSPGDVPHAHHRKRVIRIHMHLTPSLSS